jgi:hypothetical protein
MSERRAERSSFMKPPEDRIKLSRVRRVVTYFLRTINSAYREKVTNRRYRHLQSGGLEVAETPTFGDCQPGSVKITALIRTDLV